MSSDGTQVVADPDPDLSWYEHKAAHEVHVVELREVVYSNGSWVVKDASPPCSFSFGDQPDAELAKSEQFALDHLAAVRAERRVREETERRTAEMEAEDAAERDAWAGCHRAEIIRQAEYQRRRADRLDDALDTVKARYAAREDALREASNALFSMESTITELRRQLDEARS